MSVVHEQTPAAAGEEPQRPVTEAGQEAPRRPTVDEMGEWSFPASDPPATWTWEPRSG
jgi:hypothetical protein